MCHASIALISDALDDVDNAEYLLKIKGVVALFIQTMGVRALSAQQKIYIDFNPGLGLLCLCT
jgi:hypothetical protein